MGWEWKGIKGTFGVLIILFPDIGPGYTGLFTLKIHQFQALWLMPFSVCTVYWVKYSS